MKVLAFLGSPRKNGYTASLMNEYLRGLKEKNKNISIKEVFLQKQKIEPCKACNWCKKNGNDKCKIDDDMQKFYKQVKKADIIIFATPIYWFNMSAQMKLFIDRLYALNFKKFPSDKKIVLLTTFGDTNEKTSGAVNAVNTFNYIAKFLKMDFIQSFGRSSEVTKKEWKQTLDEAYLLGKKTEI